MTRALDLVRFGLPLLTATLLVGCGRDACPSAISPTHADEWGAAMAQRTVMNVDPERTISIKRDVHYFDVSVSAEKFTQAFHETMIDPERRFGLIRIDRDPHNLRQPFQLHERFQGRYVLPSDNADADLVCRVENAATSDYGEIVLLHLDANPEHRYYMRYAYLSGSPMAGSSTFEVQAIDDGACRVTQTFVYQEINVLSANLFTLGVLKLHDQVVYSQVSQSAARAGGQITGTDLQGSYTRP